MPTLSMFFGIVIRMYYAPKEHDPPHIHAIYQGSEAVLRVEDGEVTPVNCRGNNLNWFRLG